VTLRTGSDPGTNLYDKRGLLVKLEIEVSKSRRYHRPMCMAVLRPERPQPDMPKGATDVLRKQLRTPDAVAHMGAGVFAMMLPECDVAGARAVFQRLLPDLQAATGIAYQQAVADVSQDSDPVIRILDKLGAPIGSLD